MTPTRIGQPSCAHSMMKPPLGPSESLLVEHTLKSYGLLASDMRLHCGLAGIKGGTDAAGTKLPFLPAPIAHAIVSRLDLRGQLSLHQLWVDRLSMSAREALLASAGRAYGFSRGPTEAGWEAFLNASAARACRAPAGPPSDVLPADACLAGLLLGSLGPEAAVQRLPGSRAVVARATEQDADVLFEAAPSLRNDRDLVWRAVGLDGRVLAAASSELQEDADLVMLAVRQNGRALRYAGARLQDSPDIVLAALSTGPAEALQFASSRLCDDKDTMLAAVKLRGDTLRFVSDRLKDCPEVVSAAVERSADALIYASDNMTGHRGVVLRSLIGGGSLSHASRALQLDRELLLAAVKMGQGWQLSRTNGLFADDREMMLALAHTDGGVLDHASFRLCNDPELVGLAIQRGGLQALEGASARLRQDPWFRKRAAEAAPGRKTAAGPG